METNKPRKSLNRPYVKPTKPAGDTASHKSARVKDASAPDRGHRPVRKTEQTGRKPQGFAGFRPRSSKGGTSRKQKAAPGRLAALKVLNAIRVEDCFLSEALDQVLPELDLKKEDAAFARLLATEVVARRGSLDELINSVLNDPNDVNDDVREALRISFCEIFYLGKPDHVAVDQGVELVRETAHKAVGLANFVLRRAVEGKGEFPFGDAATDNHAAGLRYGFPQWLVDQLSEYLGTEASRTFMERSNEPAPLFFMLNVARIDGAEALQSLVRKGLKIAPVPALIDDRPGFPLFAFADRSAVAHPDVAMLLKEGALVISDAAALSIAMLALPDAAPKRFLEIGAGRGTKSILLQNTALLRYGSQMKLETLDLNALRTTERTARLKRARIEESASYIQDATNLQNFEAESYDAVFVDAPCSGVGTLRRHQDIRWRLAPEDVEALAKTGQAMLCEAARLVAPGGRLTYATCTVLPQENEQVIQAFLGTEAGKCFALEKQASTLSLADAEVTGPLSDAHFVAVFQRVS